MTYKISMGNLWIDVLLLNSHHIRNEEIGHAI